MRAFSFGLLAVLSLAATAQGQLTISDPGAAADSIRQTSSTDPRGIVAARRDAASKRQIQVKVQYLLVDADTRRSIYAAIDPSVIKNSIRVPEEAEQLPLNQRSSDLDVQRIISTASRVTCCLLEDAEVVELLKTASLSPHNDISNAPGVILLDGKDAEMNDVVQHPFVVDINEEGGLLKPKVHSMDDGIRLKFWAAFTSSPEEPAGFDIRSEVRISQVLDVRSDEIFGVAESPLSVQVPIHQVTTVVISQKLLQGQTLLVDPHVVQTKSVEVEKGVPMFNKIPYVGKSLGSVSVEDVEQHMILILRPSTQKRR